MKLPVLSVVLWCATTIPAGAADRSPACDAKRAAIEAQIAEATPRGRTAELAGLKRALAANKARCTDASLAKARDVDIRDAQHKVAERQRALTEAERKGDAKKIASRQAKLDEARAALAEAEKPLAP